MSIVLRVAVVSKEMHIGEDLPDIFGHYQILDDGLRFVPLFPFEPGLSYRARFEAKALAVGKELSKTLTLDFSLTKDDDILYGKVTHIFPSSEGLPENLLRFYVSFSEPMQRGRAQTAIKVLGPNGEPAPDVLYRAPIELWDRSMRLLTVLLDPGRLKRGVGPNRELGAPLKVGQEYTLAIGCEMLDLRGLQLREPFYKRFLVTKAIRESISVEHWTIEHPLTGTRQPLVIIFPRPLDWSLLWRSISVVFAKNRIIEGSVAIDEQERRWSFTPKEPWAPGNYEAQVTTDLEDVCGNNIAAPFDRPLRSSSELAFDVTSRSVPFQLV